MLAEKVRGQVRSGVRGQGSGQGQGQGQVQGRVSSSGFYTRSSRDRDLKKWYMLFPCLAFTKNGEGRTLTLTLRLG